MAETQDTRWVNLANMVRVGTVVEVDSENNTATVLLNEYGGGDSSSYYATITQKQVKRTCKILNRGSLTKDYFNYQVGEKVVCIFPITVGGTSFLTDTGYIAGSFFDDDRKPPKQYEKVRGLYLDDKNYIEVNLEEKTLNVEFEGAISINGQAIYLNG